MFAISQYWTGLGLLLISSYTLALPLRVGDIGEIHPDNPKESPFSCATQLTALGEPISDNQAGRGYRLQDEQGFSEHCGAATRVDYYYKSTDPQPGEPSLKPLADPRHPPADVAKIRLQGRERDYIVRYERGVINRFIYGIGMIAPRDLDVNTPDLSAWNRKVIYYFGGAVGVGRSQASGYALSHVGDKQNLSAKKRGVLDESLLEQGYAVLASSGTVTATHYDLPLSAQTAEMVVEQFSTAYAKPKYVFGFGGSGGAIQQFHIAENKPQLLDGLVPTHVYPDMITQVTDVSDCELLEYYFDITEPRLNRDGKPDPKWQDWRNREKVEGFHALNNASSDWDLQNKGVPLGSSASSGSTECIEGWRGLLPLIINPKAINPTATGYKALVQQQPEVFSQTAWTFFDSMRHVFPVNKATGMVDHTIDNVGVQYGLSALVAGDLNKTEFFEINARVGSWLPVNEMRQERVPYYPFGVDGLVKNPKTTLESVLIVNKRLDGQAVLPVVMDIIKKALPAFKTGTQIDHSVVNPWSSRNTTAGRDSKLPVALRVEGSLASMRSAYDSGLVMRGNFDTPTIMLVPYLEDDLDMHNAKQAFMVRARMLKSRGSYSNTGLWFVDDDSELFMTRVHEAFNTLEIWLNNGSKPARAIDRCFDDKGLLIAAGDEVFNGNMKEPGPRGRCATQYPIYSSARMNAGSSLLGPVFKCHTQSIDQAIVTGVYGDIQFDHAEKLLLEKIFSTGVCDYSKGDMADPLNMRKHLVSTSE